MAKINDWLIVIPARIGSTRLPRKALADLAGKPMIVRVFENLRPLSDQGACIMVATDSEEIVAACAAHGIEAKMTSVDHRSGTDRCFEVARGEKKSFILNVQGDEPFVSTEDLCLLMDQFSKKESADIGTLGIQNRNLELQQDSSYVKIVMNNEGDAMYFSRSPIPYYRNKEDASYFWQHLGIYAYRKDSLKKFCELPASQTEIAEGLEQLRALENQMKIHVTEARSFAHGIDTEKDLEAARERYSKT